MLRFQLPDTAFGVAVEDLLANDCVYVPHANVFVTRQPAPVTLDEYLKKIAGQKTVLEQVRQKPDQDFPQAWSVVHNPIQDLGPMMISLANDNRKFIALREGGILFDEYDRPDDPRSSVSRQPSTSCRSASRGSVCRVLAAARISRSRGISKADGCRFP